MGRVFVFLCDFGGGVVLGRMVGRRITWQELVGPPPGQLQLALEPF